MNNMKLNEKLIKKEQKFKLIKKGIFILSIPVIATFTNGCQEVDNSSSKPATEQTSFKEEFDKIFLIVGGVITIPPHAYYYLKGYLEELDRQKREKQKQEKEQETEPKTKKRGK